MSASDELESDIRTPLLGVPHADDNVLIDDTSLTHSDLRTPLLGDTVPHATVPSPTDSDVPTPLVGGDAVRHAGADVVIHVPSPTTDSDVPTPLVGGDALPHAGADVVIHVPSPTDSDVPTPLVGGDTLPHTGADVVIHVPSPTHSDAPTPVLGGDAVVIHVPSPTHSDVPAPVLGGDAVPTTDVVSNAPSTDSDTDTPLSGGGNVSHDDADVVTGDAGTEEAWGDFVNDANTFIQWLLSTVFLFIPTKLIVESAKLLVTNWSQTPPVTSTAAVIIDFLSKAEKSYFPRIFLPSILLYAAFYMSARAFKDKRLKFSFEVIGLFTGVLATFVLLYFLDAGGWKFTFGALIVFFVAFSPFKGWDCYH